MPSVEKLLAIASDPLATAAPCASALYEQHGDLGRELYSMLLRKNGFYAFESALHVFPSGIGEAPMSLEAWNAESLWRGEYGGMLKGFLFFSEDAFGHPYAIRDDAICFVDAETGDSEVFATDFNEWALKILEEYEVHTGYASAHAWQSQHGPLAAGRRLIPKIPFVCGGEYTLDNLYAGDAIEAMKFRGSLAQQIKDLPDGTVVDLRVEE